ncbi:hypothetical protein [Nocardia sp. CY15]|uniref:hypothetical protein n=2 Tax=Nocardia TaxID=1817 RepID=UPI00135C6F8B|nr:hypothetical protein [Nocardia sp. CY15]
MMSRPAQAMLAGRPRRKAVARTPRRIRHIHIETGGISLDFQACAEQIADLAAELGAHGGFVITVDDDVRPDLPPLPCGELWE